MYSLELARDEDGLYIITDHNDERLYIIGQMLLNDAIRNGLKKALKFAQELGLDETKELETTELKVKISPKSMNKIYIKFIEKEHPQEILETDMSIEKLVDLIDSYEEAILEEPEIITLTRAQDTFTLKA